MPSTGINPDPNIPNQYVPQPNIYNIHWSKVNNPFPLLHLSALAPELTPTNVDLLQPTAGLPNIHQVSKIFFDRLHGTPKIFQYTPWSLKLSATNAVAPWNIVNQRRGFKSGVADPWGLSRIFPSVLLRRALRKHWHWPFDQSKSLFCMSLWLFGLRNLFH